MDSFARMPREEREIYFVEAANRLRLPPQVVEKDLWVCWTLKRLFSLDVLSNQLLFKGGTSLSKVFGLIRRFSEDIDLSIDRHAIGFDGEDDPASPEISGKQRQRQIDSLKSAVQDLLRDWVIADLTRSIREQLGDGDWRASLDRSDPDGQSLAFVYPRTGVTGPEDHYLRPAVKIEFGARSDHWPSEIRTIQPLSRGRYS